MFATPLFPLVSLVLVAASALEASASALPSAALAFRHAHRHIKVRAAAAPSAYAQGDLEDYHTYHARYLQLDCEAKHNTPFNECCSPLLANQTASSLPVECNSADSSSSVPTSPGAAPEGSSPADPSTASSSTPAASAPADSVEAPPAAPTPSLPPPSTSAPPAPAMPSLPPPAPASPSTLGSAAADISASGENNGVPISGGVATFYYQEGTAGTCGIIYGNSALIGALPQSRYGSTNGLSAICGQQVKVTNVENGKSVTVTVADECPSCKNANSIDLSIAAFEAIASLATGEVDVTLQFVN